MKTQSPAGSTDQVVSKIVGRDCWMVVDAARDKRVFEMLLDCFYTEHRCLFRGATGTELELAAPYLVSLKWDDEKTRRFLKVAWGRSWGIFLHCDAREQALISHLRELLVVRDPSGNEMIFRYYDPRILRNYLPTCTPNEWKMVFGPIKRFLMEDDEPDVLLNFDIATGPTGATAV